MILPLLLLACSESVELREAQPVVEPIAPPPRSEPEPEEVPVEDQGPVIHAITIGPPDAAAGTDLTVEVEADDPDGDRVDVKRQWMLNGEPLPGQVGRALSRSRFRKGDRVQVSVEATDGTLTTLGRSPEITIRNSPPAILNRTRDLTRIEGYRIQATDPDGDPLTFSLRNAPASLAIDPRKGVLAWHGTETEAAGRYEVGIRVEDPEGAYAEWTFGLTVEAGSKASRPEDAPPGPGGKTPTAAAPPKPAKPAPPAEEPPPKGAAPVETYQPPSRW